MGSWKSIQGGWTGHRGGERAAGRPPVVLLHGFASSARVTRTLSIHLRRRLGRPTMCWEISPGREDLRATAADLQRRLAGWAAGPGEEKVDIVAHSMGGLVATWLLKRLDLGRRVRRVVTLGTPHRGVALARAGAWLMGDTHPALHQMCPGSSLLEEMASLPLPACSELLSIAGGNDRLVRAERARVAELPGQVNLCLDDANHWSLLFCESALDAVSDALAARPPASSVPHDLAA